ncbi:MAG TPA: PTS glucose transporter subunit IIA [Ktedonobacteraceae bacterium]|nr:PTS glucose transporter subunit IIA [Ktedonobacteraceae bacterium]
MMTEVYALAPLDGRVVDLEGLPDEVFAQKMAGDGLAIDPTGAVAVAPVTDRLVKLFPGGHAFGLAWRGAGRPGGAESQRGRRQYCPRPARLTAGNRAGIGKATCKGNLSCLFMSMCALPGVLATGRGCRGRRWRR